MRLYVGTDSLYLAVADSEPVTMRALGPNVTAHLDAEGELVGVEVFEVNEPDGFQVEALPDADHAITWLIARAAEKARTQPV